MSSTFEQDLSVAVIEFREEEIQSIVRQALDTGMEPQEVVLKGLLPGLAEVGRLYGQGEYFLPELVMCGSTVKTAMDILDPLLSTGDSGQRVEIVIGTVAADFHDIGKNIVISMLKGAGYGITDLGIDVATSTFVETVKKKKPQILGMSALLLTTRQMMAEVILALREAGVRDHVKVIVGGCAVP